MNDYKELVERLRESADRAEHFNEGPVKKTSIDLRQAANTIEDLSTHVEELRETLIACDAGFLGIIEAAEEMGHGESVTNVYEFRVIIQESLDKIKPNLKVV